MNPENAIDLSREAIKTCMMVGGPILLASLAIGLIVGVIQAMTQVQDQTVSFVPKALALLALIGLCLPWLTDRMMDFAKTSFETPMNMQGIHGSSAPVALTGIRTADRTSQPVSHFMAPILETEETGSATPIQPTRRSSRQSPESTEVQAESPFTLPHYQYFPSSRAGTGG